MATAKAKAEAQTADELLALIAANGAAMAALDSPSCAVEGARPPLVHPPDTRIGGIHLGGTMVVKDDGITPVDPGAPGRTLADLIRDAVKG